MNIRLLSPAGSTNTIVVNGRSYTAAAGTVFDVADFDAVALVANGWVPCNDGVGTTAQRPVVPPFVGFRYFDTTVPASIIWDGVNWRKISDGSTA